MDYYTRLNGPSTTNLRKNTRKARNLVWMIATTGLLAFICVASRFWERCKASSVFDSLSFRISWISFISFVGSSIYLVIKSKRARDFQLLWLYNKVHLVISIILMILTISLFTYAIYPAYDQASFVFSSVFLIFFINLGVMILLD